MSKKSDHSQQPEVDTQPSRVKKKQQKHLAIAVIAVGLIGWLFYSFLSSHGHLQPQRKKETPARSFRSIIHQRMSMVRICGWSAPKMS